MFLYEKTHRYLRNDYQFFDALKIKNRKIRGNCSLLTKVKFHELESSSTLIFKEYVSFSFIFTIPRKIGATFTRFCRYASAPISVLVWRLAALLCCSPLRCFTKLSFSTFVEPDRMYVKDKLLQPLILFSHLLQVLQQTSFSTLLFMWNSSLQLSSVSYFCTVMNFADLPTLATFELEAIISKINLKNWNLTMIDFST